MSNDSRYVVDHMTGGLQPCGPATILLAHVCQWVCAICLALPPIFFSLFLNWDIVFQRLILLWRFQFVETRRKYRWLYMFKATRKSK